MIGTLSLLSIVSRIGQLSGALIAGYVSEYASYAVAYFVLAITHIIAVYCFTKTTANRVGHERQGDANTTGILEAVTQYARVLRSSRLLVLLILLAT